MHALSLDDRPVRARRAFGWAWAWAGFWVLMLAAGVQEYAWGGGRHLWEPVLDYASAALMATLVGLIELRRARRHNPLFERPRQRIVRLLARLPWIAFGFVAGMYALRHAVHALAGRPYRHGPWSEVFIYESIKFTIFYLLFAGVHFGWRSYEAWTDERLRAEQQTRLASEARLALLTQQLQPHFLFNALNTVASLVHTDPDLADTLITRLATLLRAATDAGRRPTQTLSDEWVLLQAYAQIMTQRYADRVRVDWQIDAAARTCRVPTFGLQPLLENCFVHVVERRRATTHIVVRAQCHGDRLRVEIEDDGGAFESAPARGVGLDNLAQRLRALHGDAATLALLPRAGGGLQARVELPCER